MTLPALKPPATITKDPRYCPYEPYGSSLDLFYDKNDELLICGPAGTGKSRGVLEKIHLCACKYPGMRALMIRKTRTSLTQSAQVTYEKFVVPDNGSVKWRTGEQEYRYANGSTVVVGGMDKSSKVLSSDYDLIYPQEATELTEDDWEILITRCRNDVMPYNQVIGDCNPGKPKHWLNLRRKEGVTTYYKSYHEDNPRLFDHLKQDWTPQGVAYLAKLNKLTGVRKKRLLKGIWAAAEGMIYEDEWNDDIHIINRFRIPLTWRRYWVVDFGFTNPFVWQAWALDEDDRAYRFAEIYQTKLLVEDAAMLIKRWKRLEQEPFPVAIICDWDAEGRATLERHLGVDTVAADKNVLEGIEAVKVRLRDQGDGKPGMYFMRDSLIEIDWDLKDGGMPIQTEDEFEGYEWDNKKTKEQPKKIDDHGMDDVRYLCKHLDGGDGVWSRGMA